MKAHLRARRTALRIAFQLVAFPLLVGAQGGLPGRAPPAVVGCYQLTSRNSGSPSRLRLDSMPSSRRGKPTGGWRVAPSLPAYADTLFGFPPEWRTTRDSISVEWSRGFSGLTLVLAVRRDSLVGTALEWTDLVPPGGFPTRPVAYTRTACAARDG